MRRDARIAAVCAVLSHAGGARAWTPIDSAMPVWCTQVPYAMNAAGSSDMGASASESAVQAGMGDWTRVSCASLSAAYQGRVSNQAGDYDGVSMIGWRESGWRYGSSAIGVTGPRWSYSDGEQSCIEEADMELNGVNYTWVTGSPSDYSSVNAYSIILHEGGHYYGLGHSNDPDSTMYFAYSGGVDSLTTDDSNGICALYPGEGGANCSTTGCPSGYECDTSTSRCERVTGDGSVCSPCASNQDCGAPGGRCVGYPDRNYYCGSGCTRDGDCDSGDVCADAGGIGQCARLDSSGTSFSCTDSGPECTRDTDCDSSELCNEGTGQCEPRPTSGANLGEPCATSGDCNSGVCLRTSTASVCTESCDWLTPTSCAVGFYCDGSVTGSCGIGFCLAGTAGSGAIGAFCTTHTDCSTLLCTNGTCATPCIPDGAAACPQGLTCQQGALPSCGSCLAVGRTGAYCDMADDCATRICAVQREHQWCTELCRATEDCPSGFTCESAGTVSVCAPVEWPRDRSSGGCCSVVPGRPGAAWPMVLFAALVTVGWARRRRAFGDHNRTRTRVDPRSRRVGD